MTNESARAPLVLIVEDDLVLRQTLVDIIELEDLRAVAAPDGETALELARSHRPALILSDLAMPNMGGLELMSRLRADEATRGIPVILISARVEEAAVEEGLRLGAADYLCKPVQIEELMARIRARL